MLLIVRFLYETTQKVSQDQSAVVLLVVGRIEEHQVLTRGGREQGLRFRYTILQFRQVALPELLPKGRIVVEPLP